MHCYYNKLVPKHFDNYFISISSIYSDFTRLSASSASNNQCLPRVNSSFRKMFLYICWPKFWSSILDSIKSSATFTFKWKLKKHIVHEKDT